jgi:hypothetical protein
MSTVGGGKATGDALLDPASKAAEAIRSTRTELIDITLQNVSRVSGGCAAFGKLRWPS